MMDNKRLAEMLILNEPSFVYNGIEYSVCSPDGKTFHVSSEDNPSDADLSFSSVSDLLANWKIQGKPFSEVLPQTDLAGLLR